MLKSVFYVSRKTIAWPADGPDVEAITTVAISRNARLEVTGVLISTDHCFAQILEGPAAAVDEVMASILRDSRHHSIAVLADADLAARWFGQWSLAFWGRSSPISERIEPFLAQPPTEPHEIEWLREMIRALAPPG